MLTQKDKHDIRPRALHTRIPHHLPSPHRVNVSPPHVPKVTHVLTQKVITATAVTPISLNQMLLPQQSHPSHRTSCGCHCRHTHLNQPVVGAIAVTCTSPCFHSRDTRLYTISYCIHSNDNHITQPVVVAAAVTPTSPNQSPSPKEC
jgi:hypothetical protein